MMNSTQFVACDADRTIAYRLDGNFNVLSRTSFNQKDTRHILVINTDIFLSIVHSQSNTRVFIYHLLGKIYESTIQTTYGHVIQRVDKNSFIIKTGDDTHSTIYLMNLYGRVIWSTTTHSITGLCVLSSSLFATVNAQNRIQLLDVIKDRVQTVTLNVKENNSRLDSVYRIIHMRDYLVCVWKPFTNCLYIVDLETCTVKTIESTDKLFAAHGMVVGSYLVLSCSSLVLWYFFILNIHTLHVNELAHDSAASEFGKFSDTEIFAKKPIAIISLECGTVTKVPVQVNHNFTIFAIEDRRFYKRDTIDRTGMIFSENGAMSQECEDFGWIFAVPKDRHWFKRLYILNISQFSDIDINYKSVC